MFRWLLMAFTIASSVGASMSAATGRATQNHLVYAANQKAYWLLYLTGTQALSAAYSTNSGASWSAPVNSPFTLAFAHSSEGRAFGFCYANLSSTDVLHFVAGYGATNGLYHSRFTLGTTWTNTNAEASTVVGPLAIAACVTALTSSGAPVDVFTHSGGDCNGIVGANADAGSSWAAGFGARASVYTGEASAANGNFLTSLGSGNMLAVTENGSTSGFTLLEWSKYTGTWGAAATVLAGAVTSANPAMWGAVAVSTTNIYVLCLSNNSNAFVLRQFNGTSWASKTAPGSLTLMNSTPAFSGVALVTDGTDVWALAIDSSKNVQWNKYTVGSDAWGGWTVLEATRANTPGYITAVYNPDNTEIMAAWRELNGANYDLIGSVLGLAAADALMAQACF